MTFVLDRIASQGVIPVIRSDTPADAVATARASARAGMTVVELTHSVPDVEGALEQLRDDGLTLGVGTITHASQVKTAAAAGAQFVVSFACPDGFVEAAVAAGLTAIPGAFSPSEFWACAQAGATAAKLFPARLATPAYVADLRALLPRLELIVTGGIVGTRGEVEEWLRAGALAVGVGQSLGTVADVGADEVAARATRALAAAVAARSAVGVSE